MASANGGKPSPGRSSPAWARCREGARAAPARAAFLGGALALGLAACGEAAPIISALIPKAPEEMPEAAPAFYPDPEAEQTYDASYGESGGSQYDNGDEIVNGKCLPDHPVSYCTTIDGIFKQPVGTPVYKARARFLDGNRVFNANWVPAPNTVNEFRDGLGPKFDAVSCAACHVRNGRGRVPAGRDDAVGDGDATMIVRIGVRGATPGAAPKPHPLYGGQLSNRAIPDARPEARIVVDYEAVPGRYPDGETFTLRRPRYVFTDFSQGPLGDDALISPRIAPQVIGLGLVEATPDEVLLARADPDDADGDGISGRANYAPDPASGEIRLGRYGWKAGTVSLRHQTEAALAGDMGITSVDFPTPDCPRGPRACGGAGAAPEITGKDLDALVFYMRMLSPTGRRAVADPQIVRGEALFEAAGCAACHTPRMTSGVYPQVPVLSNLVFQPYADFLLHDMGEGLADGRPEGRASGREWRTPPLWGLGLTEQVNGNTNYLHDGRARTPVEAILWHGGEAAAARQAFMTMRKSERAALARFLDSL